MPRHHHKGFTLIELLVVISIIALLISILLPALKLARATAQQMECLANERQIVVAANVYASDYNDYLPPTRFIGEAVGATYTTYNTWRTTLTPYLGDRPARADVWSLPLDQQDSYNAIWLELSCPVAEFGAFGWTFDGSKMSYAMSTGLGNEYRDGKGIQNVGLPPWEVRRLSDATAPSDTMAYVDAVSYDYIFPTWANLLSPSLQELFFPGRHPSRTYSTAFIDGHAEVTERNDLTDSDASLWYYIR